MSKAEINNEIILLRHAVRQARVCVVNKLIKEAKLLRNRHGNETQQEKYKKKADKLIAEVYALKGIKDDDISKFGITNEKDLITILQDATLSPSDRVIARVAHYKTLCRRLMQFKEKYPDCKKYLVGKKKKVTKLKNKDGTKTKKSLKENLHGKSSEEQQIDSYKNIEPSQYKSKDKEMCNTEMANNSHECKKSPNEDDAFLKREKLPKLEEDTKGDKLEDTVAHQAQSSVIKPCNVTKEATVKRFTEFLEEQESSKDLEMPMKSPDSTTKQANILDDFFITDNNQDSQSSISATTSYEKSHKYNTRVRTFQSSESRVKKQNVKYKNDKNFSKRYQDKQSVKRLNDRAFKVNKSTSIGKSNSNYANNKEENTGLHPSWLAKRKEQQIISQGFQGKKIVFADD